jgi:hypothetical protein
MLRRRTLATPHAAWQLQRRGCRRARLARRSGIAGCAFGRLRRISIAACA